MADETTVYASIRDLIAQYWDIAYAEGASGVSRGDDANAVLHKIDIELDRLRTELASARAALRGARIHIEGEALPTRRDALAAIDAALSQVQP